MKVTFGDVRNPSVRIAFLLASSILMTFCPIDVLTSEGPTSCFKATDVLFLWFLGLFFLPYLVFPLDGNVHAANRNEALLSIGRVSGGPRILEKKRAESYYMMRLFLSRRRDRGGKTIKV